ncbi:hypothetical protein [Hansschlegelia beijingensis]|uniref:Uncharacterized protein n=1 Tax=Hansschlegelia beijingensis TaxID=1133344 RepID=A0A7W6D5T3_9HYPH|nr:hypothetical protein [Hansschlegelia beijingensis]MBB3972764.1 hypothetical protein [Hansschlegelia beijingensis]
MTELKVDIADVAKDVTVRVRIVGLGAFGFRVWLARKLIAAAAIVSPCAVEVEFAA